MIIDRKKYLGSGHEISYVTVGEGPHLIMFSGGPGMTSKYLEDYLIGLSKHFAVTFFDQIGCGESTTTARLSLESTVESTVELVKHVISGSEEKVYFAAHSWGALLALMVSIDAEISPVATILMNPTPFDRNGFDKVSAKLVDRVDKDTLSKIQELSLSGNAEDGVELMNEALPAYFGRETDLPKLNLEYSIATNTAVAESLGDFSFWKHMENLGELTVILGSNDYIAFEDFESYFDDGVKLINIEAGHFSMIDEPDSVLDSIVELKSSTL